MSELNIDDYQILRYRDDYRIFVNNSQIGEKILKLLTEILLNIGLKLNATKTTNAQLVIENALKIDKRAWMRCKQKDENLQKALFLIYFHCIDFPNSGSVIGALDDYYKRLISLDSIVNPIQIISIAIDIGCNNPRCFPLCAAIVSKILDMLQSKNEKYETIKRIRKKLNELPNNGYLEIWLQRISHHISTNNNYVEKLCKLVNGESVEIWNNMWINDNQLKNIIDSSNIIDKNKMKKVIRLIINRNELNCFISY